MYQSHLTDHVWAIFDISTVRNLHQIRIRDDSDNVADAGWQYVIFELCHAFVNRTRYRQLFTDLGRREINGLLDVTGAEDIGRLCAQLRGWPGARLNQDNVIWKPPGAKALGFHQDESYEDWIVPREFVTCWIALDDTRADGGTIEYVRGSHKWGLFPPIDQFHAPDVYDREMRDVAAKLSVEPEVVAVEVPAGGCVFHHGRAWHGSQSNRGNQPRRSLVAHCMSSES